MENILLPGLKTHLNQMRVLIGSNLKSRYRKTWAGFVWVVMNPLIMYGVQAMIFRSVLKIEMPHYSIFLMSGLMPWIFLQQCLEMCTPMFEFSGRFLKSFPTHPLVYLGAQIGDNLVNFTAAFLVLLIPMMFTQGFHPLGIAYLPLIFLLTTVTVASMAWYLSIIHVFFRDTRYLLHFTLSISYFLTPIFYSVEHLPEELRWIPDVNPFYIIIKPFRLALYQFDQYQLLLALLNEALLGIALLTLGTWYWRRRKNEFYLSI